MADFWDGFHPRSLVLLILAILIVLIAYFSRYKTVKHDPREPPLISPKVPYVGHLINFLWHGNAYMSILSEKYRLPIYALNILNAKTYVVNSPDLIAAVQRNAKSLSFTPLMLEVSRRMLNYDRKVEGDLRKNMMGDEEGFSYMIDLHNAQYGVLAPGPTLDKLNVDVLSRMLPFINEIKNDEKSISLLPFLRHVFTVAGSYALLGPTSPFEENPELERDMWDFIENCTYLIMDIKSNWITPKGYNGRAKVIKAMQEYVRAGGVKTSNKLLQERHRVGEEAGMTPDELAHIDTGVMFGFFINAVPSVFWLAAYICSYPSLLSEIREELKEVVSRTGESNGKVPVVYIDVSKFRQHCPIFCSTYQEVLRLISSHSTGRMVVKDTVINDQYLLKEGSVIQMPGLSVHLDTEIWGADAKEFKPHRFITSKVPAAAFRAFGGGSTMCPGRWFAFTEIMSLVAVLLLGFDITPTEGKWKLPKQDSAKMPLGVANPQTSIEVKMKPTKEFEGVQWRFTGEEHASR